MLKKIYKTNNRYIRVLRVTELGIYVIDCDFKHMPSLLTSSDFDNAEEIEETSIFNFAEYDMISPKDNKLMHDRYTLIAPLLPYIFDKKERGHLINMTAKENNLSHMTVREYICKYLAAQDIRILLPKHRDFNRELTDFEKNIRWALNKYYYTDKKNSLTYAYKMMLNTRYTDCTGQLLNEYPSFPQFRYFYQKTKTLMKEAIRRDGIKNYQKNKRPLLGDALTEFAPALGTAMLDSTICDIYLINDSLQVIGRPVLTACIDVNTQLLMGFSVGFEGGIYSVRRLLENVIEDKVEYCRKKGITITYTDWPCNSLPGQMLTDKGSEYKGENLEQIVDLGVTLVNLSSYRPDLKGLVEKFFDIIQGYFKPILKGKGVVEPNYQERGSHDYKKDAALTIEQFEKILIECVIFYNTKRILKNYPYDKDMLDSNIQPYCNKIWNYRLEKLGSNLISVDPVLLNLTLLPRTTGKFTRKGLIVNNARYKNEAYVEEYLSNKVNVIVAYNPDNASLVYLIADGKYIEFELIESRYNNLSFAEIQNMQKKQKELIDSERTVNLQASIDLTNSILAIRSQSCNTSPNSIKDIRSNRQKEINRKKIKDTNYE